MNDVSSSDAGVYTCTQSDGRRKIDTTTVFTVTGIVPHFTQAPVSYIALNTLPDPYIQFNFEISFKPQNSDGTVFSINKSFALIAAFFQVLSFITETKAITELPILFLFHW